MSERESPEPERAGRLRDAGLAPGGSAAHAVSAPVAAVARVTFDRQELRILLDLYGRKVADGEWRDYAIDFERDRAVFSVYRRTAEFPLYRIEKTPRLARRQGAFAVVAASGLVMKRGHDLDRVVKVLDRPRLVVS